jgi:serine/threonine protein kinase
MIARLDRNLQREHRVYFPVTYCFLELNKTSECAILMEYLNGYVYNGNEYKHLEDLIKAGILSIEEKTQYCEDLAKGIAAMHSVSIWHGDLKSENIVISGDKKNSKLKIIDLSAQLIDDSRKNCCADSHVMGTMGYMAPEQIITNINTKYNVMLNSGKLSDWWTYGLLVFEITMGHRLYSYNVIPEDKKSKFGDGRYNGFYEDWSNRVDVALAKGRETNSHLQEHGSLIVRVNRCLQDLGLKATFDLTNQILNHAQGVGIVAEGGRDHGGSGNQGGGARIPVNLGVARYTRSAAEGRRRAREEINKNRSHYEQLLAVAFMFLRSVDERPFLLLSKTGNVSDEGVEGLESFPAALKQSSVVENDQIARAIELSKTDTQATSVSKSVMDSLIKERDLLIQKKMEAKAATGEVEGQDATADTRRPDTQSGVSLLKIDGGSE